MAVTTGVGPPVDVEVATAIGEVTVDAGRFEQVMRNLLDNARTHTPPDGRITVRLSATADEVTIAVQDTGRGIDAEHLPYVFDRFYRADTSRTRATGGAGLGLAIVRQLVLAHGGTVTAKSAGAGRGSTFAVSLPRSTASRHQRASVSNVS
jgi:signal transduction histidine kinase